MIYLIGQLSIWLFLTAAFAAVAGWAFAAERGEAAERSLRRDRDNLIRDLARLASAEAGPAASADEDEREVDGLRRLIEIRDGRIAELERSLETARMRADDAASEADELRRRLEREGADAEEVQRLRALADEAKVEDSHVIDVEPEPAAAPAAHINEEALALQAWRLRYFEQRVQYLENHARQAAPAPAPQVNTLPLEWRSREAEARARFLEDELRRIAAAPAMTPPPEALSAEAEEEAAPFASDAGVDVLLRWRLLYLERRTAHLQAELAKAAARGEAALAPEAEAEPETQPEPVAEAAPDPDRWKWRARYLEARVRHLEQRLADAEAAANAASARVEARALADAAEPAPAQEEPRPAARPRGAKPAVLGAARNGAPDDLTLIDGVSLMQQSTLYSLGVFHFDQIAAWTPENVAWVDQYLRLGGRIDEEEWVEQAALLAREGPAASRRAYEEA